MRPIRGEIWERKKDRSFAVVDLVTDTHVYYTVFPEKQGYKKTLEDFARDFLLIRPLSTL